MLFIKLGDNSINVQFIESIEKRTSVCALSDEQTISSKITMNSGKEFFVNQTPEEVFDIITKSRDTFMLSGEKFNKVLI